MMNDLCQEKHRRINDCFDTQNKRLNNHSERIDKLEQFRSGTEVEIRNLIEQIKGLVATIKWGTGIVITSLIGFFI
ncbi:MAG: hypothetical protein EOL95_12040, partial [Bacteroidia bacterium]|nr:hypothetical protein [Bacteroidia bacterium]